MTSRVPYGRCYVWPSTRGGCTEHRVLSGMKPMENNRRGLSGRSSPRVFLVKLEAPDWSAELLTISSVRPLQPSAHLSRRIPWLMTDCGLVACNHELDILSWPMASLSGNDCFPGIPKTAVIPCLASRWLIDLLMSSIRLRPPITEESNPSVFLRPAGSC